MTPAAIQRTLESGIMKTQAAPLSARRAPEDRDSSRHGRDRRAAARGNREPVFRGRPWKEGPAWASWGGGLPNTRFQSAKDAGFQADDLPRLKLKWAFAFPDTSTMRSQPAVYRGRVFVGRTGRQRLRSRRGDGLRPLVHHRAVAGALRDHGGRDRGKPALFFGDSAGYVYALDGATGKQLWKMRPDEHPASTVTATPVFYQGRLYVGSASREEALSVSAAYPCCTFRGSETAVDAATGKVIWKRYMIPEAAKERPKANGRRGSLGAFRASACGPLPRSTRNTTPCT